MNGEAKRTRLDQVAVKYLHRANKIVVWALAIVMAMDKLGFPVGSLLAVLAAFVGLFGVVLGLGWLCCHLSELEPLGVPWLAPFAPDVPKSPCDVTRTPVRRAKLREVFLHPQDRRNQR